jgi:hypothetical protein
MRERPWQQQQKRERGSEEVSSRVHARAGGEASRVTTHSQEPGVCACEGASPRRNVKNRYRRDVVLRTEQNREKRSTWIRRARSPQPPVRRAGLRTQPKSYNLTSARQASPVSAIGAAQRSLARAAGSVAPAATCALSRGPWLRTHRAARPAMLLRRVAPPTQKG